MRLVYSADLHSIGGDASQPKMPSGGIWTRPQGTAETAITRPETGDDSPYSRRTGETSIYLQDWRPSPFVAMLYDLVLQRLPSDEMIDLLVSRCRPAMEWHTTLIHWGTLEHEIRLFKAMRSTPAVKQVDPAWVAMLLQVRPRSRVPALTLQILLIGLSNGERLAAFDSLASDTWPECVHLCLQAAEWATTPRYRSIVVRRRAACDISQ